jgi:hypothetical protein
VLATVNGERKRAVWILVVLLAAFGGARLDAHVTAFPDHGHEPGLTYTAVALSKDVVRVLYTVPHADLERLHPDGRTPEDFSTVVAAGLAIENLDRPCPGSVVKAVDYDSIDAYQYTLDFRCTAALDFVTFRYSVFGGDAGHVNLTEVLLGGNVLQVPLDVTIDKVDVPVAHLAWERGASWAVPDDLPRLAGAKPTTSDYFVLGFHHVLAGYDHVAFVIGLVFVLVSVRSLAVAITAFTLAHSVTLGLSAAGLWVVPEWIAEPLIALSILYVGLENLFVLTRSGSVEAAGRAGQAALSRRRAVAFAFGLVHGFGFSYMLREVGLPEREFLISLASFNIGVEAGQIGVVVLPLVALRALTRLPRMQRAVALAGSSAIALVGAWWLLERTLYV